MNTIEAARNKWHSILVHFGIDQSFLRDVHGPCPICEGKDRFRWDNKDGRGTYYCNQCGSGDGMDLAIRFSGKEFKTACREIDGIVGNIREGEAPQKKDGSKRINMILPMLKDVSNDGPVRKYLAGRKLPSSTALKEVAELGYYNQGDEISKHPAMVARISSMGGGLASLHVTYLTTDGGKADVPSPKKILTPMNDMNGGAVRLTKVYAEFGIAEGIETALAVMKLYKVPCWAATSAGMMEKFQPPPGTKKLTIYSDNDESFTGQKAAYTLAARMYLQKIACEVVLPKAIGDFADLID